MHHYRGTPHGAARRESVGRTRPHLEKKTVWGTTESWMVLITLEGATGTVNFRLQKP